MTRGALLLQDDTRAHTSQVALAATTTCCFEILPHPSYSPDLSPSDLYLFTKLNITFVVGIFETMRES